MLAAPLRSRFRRKTRSLRPSLAHFEQCATRRPRCDLSSARATGAGDGDGLAPAAGGPGPVPDAQHPAALVARVAAAPAHAPTVAAAAPAAAPALHSDVLGCALRKQRRRAFAGEAGS